VFNLNDPRWGRGDDSRGDSDAQSGDKDDTPPRGQRPQGPNQGPPDLDELWRDFNRKLGGLLGGKGGGHRGGSGGPSGFNPSPKSAGIGAGLIGVALLIWLGPASSSCRKASRRSSPSSASTAQTVGAGINWRLPYPIERHETVAVTQLRSVDVGRDAIVPATGLRESSMLTADENIVDIKFVVQYRLSDARAYLFESRDPDAAVIKAAETAVREVVGKMKMDAALVEERDQIAPRVRTLMQTILDRYKVGVEVEGVNLSMVCGRPSRCRRRSTMCSRPVRSATAPRTRPQAYANDVVPRARGAASRWPKRPKATGLVSSARPMVTRSASARCWPSTRRRRR
jgi:modulator of FtsH protease HflK